MNYFLGGAVILGGEPERGLHGHGADGGRRLAADMGPTLRAAPGEPRPSPAPPRREVRPAACSAASFHASLGRGEGKEATGLLDHLVEALGAGDLNGGPDALADLSDLPEVLEVLEHAVHAADAEGRVGRGRAAFEHLSPRNLLSPVSWSKEVA